jgi:sporulation protein YlmC with PRC-barrel domain
MQVYDGDGNSVGKVQDIAFTVGKMGMTLIVETKKGEFREIAWEELQAAGEIIVLKPKVGPAQPAVSAAQPMAQQPMAQASPSQTPVCPTCGQPLTYIPQYQRWYCYKDNKYV